MAKKVKSKKLNKKSSSVKIRPNNKKFSFIQRILAFIELGRPVEWSKSLLNMVLAALMVVYVYSGFVNPLIFVAGFFSVALLWSGLYALNDWTDWRIDAIHDTKKNRPIPSGKVTPLQGLVFSLLMIIISFAIAFFLAKDLLVICLLAMLVNQLLYTTKPFRLKSRKYFDVISGSMVNPFFRYFSGIGLFIPASTLLSIGTPLLPIIFVIGLQFSGYSLYRMFSTKHDLKVKMKSSVALLPEKLMKNLSYFAMGIGILAYLLLIVNGATWKNPLLGYLPIQYVLAIIVVLLQAIFTPAIKYAILNPGKAHMGDSYKGVYTLTIVFVIANILVLYLFP